LGPQNQGSSVDGSGRAGVNATPDSYGCGAIGATSTASAAARAGGSGANGIVIVELYA
jgi:hypothetical protein